ncbi:MAG: chemotaxis-specific protein-glutamate methyltransferase CheB [Lachnospiraceae bacterium]|nr:chemotaxis-specific protein-glutamate methyltransferase CheB [Lachnospiraceae bacterium]
MEKKILIVDDSALMRRVLCDIIDNDSRFHVVAKATNGVEALDLLSRNQYDAVVLDVNMPKMNGLELLKELRKFKIPARVLMASTDTKEGAKTTLDALELGALDFIHKPDNAADLRLDNFSQELLRLLDIVANSRAPHFASHAQIEKADKTNKSMLDLLKKKPVRIPGHKIVAIASSTGGPKALQSVIPRLPGTLDAPVVLVQHMPAGFTASLAERLNGMGDINVKEAAEGDVLERGWVYIAKAGQHMNIVKDSKGMPSVHYSNEPKREGVIPCANYMYESLANLSYDNIVCVVMTGMGADGTEGIQNLKKKKKIYCIAQNQDTCTVYGMPKSVTKAGLSDLEVPLEQIAQEITLHIGVTH